MYSANIWPESASQSASDKPQAWFISGKLPMTKDEGCIFVEYTVGSYGSYDIYYGDITLGCWVNGVAM